MSLTFIYLPIIRLNKILKSLQYIFPILHSEIQFIAWIIFQYSESLDSGQSNKCKMDKHLHVSN